jgi:hypothetical protein
LVAAITDERFPLTVRILKKAMTLSTSAFAEADF